MSTVYSVLSQVLRKKNHRFESHPSKMPLFLFTEIRKVLSMQCLHTSVLGQLCFYIFGEYLFNFFLVLPVHTLLCFSLTLLFIIILFIINLLSRKFRFGEKLLFWVLFFLAVFTIKQSQVGYSHTCVLCFVFGNKKMQKKCVNILKY